MGSIEKQLAPMRGSMWPTSESVKPFEDKLRKMQAEEALAKGKKHLNFEEMLETWRKRYNHKSEIPAKKLIEEMLDSERTDTWKN